MYTFDRKMSRPEQERPPEFRTKKQPALLFLKNNVRLAIVIHFSSPFARASAFQILMVSAPSWAAASKRMGKS